MVCVFAVVLERLRNSDGFVIRAVFCSKHNLSMISQILGKTLAIEKFDVHFKGTYIEALDAPIPGVP